MSFREKSAWIMSIALLSGGLLYFRAVVSGSPESGPLASPLIPHVLWYSIGLVAVAIVGHMVIAALAPGEAHATVDERERQIFERAGHYSSYVLTGGVVVSLGVYLLSNNGDLLFYTVFASLMACQLAEYLFQVFFYRSSI